MAAASEGWIVEVAVVGLAVGSMDGSYLSPA